LREFRQFGIEAIGSISPQIDAEGILLGVEALRAIGLKTIDLQLNSVGCEQCRPQYKEALKDFIEPKLDSMCDDCQRRFKTNILRILDCKRDPCKKPLQDAPTHLQFLCRECTQHFASVQELLAASKCEFTLNPYLVRGLDYYTKTVFEFISPLLGAQDAVGGGGRYDGMVELFGGPSIPAIGFACGMERTLLAVGKEGIEEKTEPVLDCYLVTMDNATDKKAFELLVALRGKGLRCEKDYLSRSMKAQMKDADRNGAAYVIIVGTEELVAGEVTIRKMSDGSQKRVVQAADTIANEIQSGKK
jgi:histidyl-tRNA synthetase